MGALAEILKLFLIDLAIIALFIIALIPLAKFKKATFAVLKRNFVGYFSNPTGYVFLCLFVLLTSFAAFWPHDFFSANMATLDQLNKYLPYIMLVFIPAITMSIWSEERREGTDELLLTIPAGDVDIVLGKYLAAAAIFSASLLFSQLSNFAVLSMLAKGGVDLGLFFSTYLGYWLIGMAMLSVGMVASFLTSNLTVGFILGAAFNAPLAFAANADLIFARTGWVQVVSKASISSNFEDLGRGVLSLPPLVYFVGVTLVGIYLSIVLIGRRHWLGGRDGSSLFLHYCVRAVSVVAIALGLTVYATNNLGFIRFDLTSNRINSLSPKTYALLEGLQIDKARPVNVHAFVSKNLPETFVKTKYDLISMLREIDEKHDRINVDIHENMEPLTKEATQVKDRYGIDPRAVPVISTGSFTTQQIFLAVVVECGLEKSIVPFFNDPGNIEYELMRSICTVAQTSATVKSDEQQDEADSKNEAGKADSPQRRTVGIVRTDAHVGGISISDEDDFMLARQLGEIPEQALVGLLEKQHEVVKKVDATKPIPEGEYNVLLVVQPSSLPQPQLDHIKDAILRGQPTAIFEDPSAEQFPFCPGTDDPRLPMRPPMQGMMQPQMPEPKGDIATLFDLLGIKMVRAKAGTVVEPRTNLPTDTPKLRWNPFTAVVFQNYNPYPKVGTFEDEVVFANRNAGGIGADEKAFNPDHPIVSGLHEVAFITPGAIQQLTAEDIEVLKENNRETLQSKLEFTPLVRILGDTGILADDESVALIQPVTSRKFDQQEVEEFPQTEAEIKEFQRRYYSIAAEKGKLHTFNQPYILAARVREKISEDEQSGDAKKNPINVTVVCDADVLSSMLMTFRDRPLIIDINYQFQNVAFVLNVIDDLAGDDRFIEIRKRQVNHPSLRVIEDRIQEALEEMSQEREKYEEQLSEQFRLAALKREEEIRKLREQVKKLEEKTGEVDVRARQDAERKLQAIIARNEEEKEKNTKALQEQVRKKIEEQQRQLNVDRRSIQNTYKAVAVMLPPIPPLLVGFVVFVRRRLREREGVSKQRLRL